MLRKQCIGIPYKEYILYPPHIRDQEIQPAGFDIHHLKQGLQQRSILPIHPQGLRLRANTNELNLPSNTYHLSTFPWQLPLVKWKHPSFLFDDNFDQELQWALDDNQTDLIFATLPEELQFHDWIREQIPTDCHLLHVQAIKSIKSLKAFHQNLLSTVMMGEFQLANGSLATQEITDVEKNLMLEKLKLHFVECDSLHVNIILAWMSCASMKDASPSETIESCLKVSTTGNFGAGIYTFPNIKHLLEAFSRNQYDEQSMLLCAVAIKNVYPITLSTDYSEQRTTAEGKRVSNLYCSQIKKGYDAHYIQVGSQNDIRTTSFDGTSNCEELVVSHRAQVLPLALVHVTRAVDFLLVDGRSYLSTLAMKNMTVRASPNYLHEVSRCLKLEFGREPSVRLSC